MHTGINTGLVVTGEVDLEKGNHGLTGDAINLASRLEGIAKEGEIVVGLDTYKQALNYFEFETLAPTEVKGKQHPVSIYKVRSAKKELFKTHRLQGLQASLR
jgi:class 3 adenylate cyclase